MNTFISLRRIRTSLLLLTFLLSFVSCSFLPLADSPPSTAPPAMTSQDPSVDPETLRTYYEAMIADLKQELLDAKQADYIIRLEYESRIQELEDKLSALSRPPEDSDIPVSGDPDPLPPSETETAPPPASNNAPASFQYEIQNQEAVIVAYLGSAHTVTVPDSIVGYPVTSIADDAFKGTPVTSVILPDTVTHIGWFAFAECPSLTSVTLPASIISIDYGAFDGCPDVTVYCPKDSYAAQYALSFGLRVRYI